MMLINFVLTVVFIIIKVAVNIAKALFRLAMSAIRALFAVKDHAPEYREQVKTNFEQTQIPDHIQEKVGIFTQWVADGQEKLENFVNQASNKKLVNELEEIQSSQEAA